MAGKREAKVAIVTDAPAPISEATAITLAQEGAIAIPARRGDRLKAVAERIEASSGKALPVVADITFQQAGSLNEESPHL